MKNWFDKFMKISGISLIIIGLISTITIILIKRCENVSEQESSILLKREHIVTEDFSNISKIQGTEIKIENNKVVVTFYEQESKLEAIYDQEYNLIDSKIMHNRIYDSWPGVVAIIAGGITISIVIWLVICIAIATIHDIIMDIKNKHRKKKQKTTE